MSASIPPRQQFIALNGLRGVAALVVVQRHAHDFLGFGVLPGGYLAVDFFFLLSGWVLAHAYDRRLETTMSGLDFMRARLLRLYPVYLLGLLLALAQALFAGDPTALGWFALSLLFLPDLWIRNFFWMIPATWSLAAELLINLPFGFGHRRLTTPILLAAVGLGAVALIATSLTYGTLDAGSMGSNWPGGLARVLFAFPLGVLLYRHRTALAGWAPRWATLPSMALLVALFSIPAWDAALQLLDLATVMIALPAVLLFASRAEPGPTLAGLATALGNMSYPIYVLHAPYFGLAQIACMALFGVSLSAAAPSAVAVLMFVLVISALLVDQWVDQPIRQNLSQRRRPNPARPADAATASIARTH